MKLTQILSSSKTITPRPQMAYCVNILANLQEAKTELYNEHDKSQ